MTTSKILIVEDEEIVALDIRQALSSSPYEVTGMVNTGRDAIRAAGETRPDLVLMDIRLKGDMDGVQAAEEIRSRLKIPVVYLTAYSDSPTVQRAKFTQPYGYLIKPFEKDELHTTIEMALYKHRMEKAVEENREWLWTILNSSGDAVLTTDTAGAVTFLNPIAVELTGWTPPAALGRPWHDVVRLDGGAAAPTEALLQALDEGKGQGFPSDAVITARDGARRPVGGSMAVARNNRSEVTGLVLVFRDISERRKLEDDLREANERLEERVRLRTAELSRANEELTREVAERVRAEDHLKFQAGILTQVRDAVIATDDKGRIIYANGGAEAVYGRAAGDMAGKALEELVSGPWIPEGLKAQEEKALAEKGAWQGSFAQKRADGRDVHVRLSVTGLADQAGILVGRLTVVQDETERKRLEGFLLHSEKLASMGQMAAAVAHELKTPLGVIYSYADLLPLQTGDKEELQSTLDSIKRQIFRCSNLVDNLLDFSRKRPPAQDERVAVKDLMGSALTLIEPYAAGRSVRIEKDDAYPPLSLLAAKGLLEQVVINLAVNAIEAMPDGGTLSLHVERAEPAPDGGVQARIRVTDTGTGIPPETLARIFEPFYTTRSSGDGKGTGLGLWLAKEVLSSLNGRIECESRPGGGTVFTVTLPARELSQEKPPKKRRTAAA